MTAPTDPSDLDISQDVLYGIAQLALEGVEGLTATTPPVRMGEFLTGRRAKGIAIERSGERVRFSLSVRIEYGRRVPAVAAEAQRAVREAVASMTGLDVESVDVTVEKVDLPRMAPAREEALPGGQA
ncbi:MAG TPA: Asp23/Gls24 family envelope stress response protein [Trueperaceae bacterium]